MIKVQLGDKIVELSWISASSLRDTLDRELRFEDMKWRSQVQAMFQREEDRRLRKEWRRFVTFWSEGAGE